MTYFLLGIKLIILFFTFAGYSFFYYDKTRMNPAFLPIVTISSVTMCMYLAGLLNILNLAVGGIALLGLSLSVYYIVRAIRHKYSFAPFFSPGVVFFLAVSAYLFFLLKGVSYTHYDNFSHWALIVKEMFQTQSFPTESSVITFQNYLPGTAAFIYYVCKIIGYRESYTLMAQALIITASLATIFSKIEWKRWISILSLFVVSMVTMSFLSYDNGTLNIYNLLVDGILAYLMIAAVICIYVYRNEKALCFYALLPILSFIVLVKDSGKIFFLEAIVLLVILWFVKNRTWYRRLKNWLYLLALVSVPLFLAQLWKHYVIKAYPHSIYDNNRFAFSKEKLAELFQSRPEGFIQNLPVALLKHAFDWSTLAGKILLFTIILSVVVIIFLLIRKKKIKLIFSTLSASLLFLIVYLGNLFVLYAFLMPPEEAVILASFNRYYATAVIIFFTLLLTALIYTVSLAGFRLQKTVNIIILCSLSVLVFVAAPNMIQLIKPISFESSARYPVSELCQPLYSKIGRNHKILLYCGKLSKKAGFYSYLLSYEMLTLHKAALFESDFGSLNIINSLRNMEYLLVLQDPEPLWTYLEQQGVRFENGHDGNTYQIKRENDQITLIALNE